MGRLISDFWTYSYKQKQYFGIVEVVKGDLTFRRAEGKYETRIERAIEYVENNRVLSHISLQSYNRYLQSLDQSYRTSEEEAYYPFFLEFEPPVKLGHSAFEKHYQRAAEEAFRTYQYLTYELNVDPSDILITLTNSRSVYMYVNPKTYGCRPSNRQHEIYRAMYDKLDDALNFQYVDKSMFRFNGLIKTPGSFYAGGYVVPVSGNELKALISDPKLKSIYTMAKRKLDRDVAGAFSDCLAELYEGAKESIGSVRTKREKNDDPTPIRAKAKCVEYLEHNVIEEGQRNHALVSLAIAYRNDGIPEDETVKKLKERANEWHYTDPVKGVARAVYKNQTNFSCQYIQDNVNVCSACEKCAYNKQNKRRELTKFKVDRNVVEQLRLHKASLRHYKAYIVMSRHQLFDTWFIPEDHDLDMRTVRELTNIIKVERTNEAGKLMIKSPENGLKSVYLVPNQFVDDGIYDQLGEQLKPYLLILTRFTYKTADKYVKMRVNISTVSRYIGHKFVGSTYKLLKALADIGLVVYKNGKLHALYFSSYKVLSIEAYKSKVQQTKTSYNANLELKTGTNDSGETATGKMTRGRGSP